MKCPVCDSRPVECPHCDGTGRIEFRRCPWQIIESQHVEVVMAVLRAEKGLLPAPGGFYDQASTFCDVFDMVNNEIADWRELLQERAARKHQAKQR